MKKFGKMTLLALCTFLASMLPTFARELTMKEFVKEVEDRQPNAGYVYIIGEYIFTSNHELTVQDVMFAAKSITVTDVNGKTNQDDIYGEMTISYIEKDGDDWVVGTPEIGDTQIELDDEKVIYASYVDYDPLPEPTHYTVTFDSDNGEPSKTTADVIEGRNVHEPSDTPTKEGYVFDGWYTESGEKYDFTTPVTEDITLKAHWLYVVDTDKIVNDAVASFTGDSYKATYDENTGTLTFDMLKPDALLSSTNGTGIVAGIRDLLNEGHVASITVTYNGQDYVFDDASMNGQYSKAYETLQTLLAAVTGKSYNTAIQEELVDKNLTLKFTLSPDSTLKEGSKDSYKVNMVSSISIVEISLPTESNDQETNDFIGYAGNEETFAVDGYKFSGKVKYHDDVYYNGKEQAPVPGYYFSFVLHVPHAIEGATLEVNGSKFTYSDLDENGNITIIFKADPDAEKKEFKVKVDADGSGSTYTEKEYTVDYSGVTFVRDSKFTIAGVDKESADDDNKTSWDGWSEKEGYQTTFTVDKQDPHTVKVTGLLPIFNQEDFEGDEYTEDALYYLAFKLQTELGTKTSSAITVKFLHDDTEETIKGTDFNAEKVLYVLKSLDTTNVDGDPIPAADRKFTITLDWDGEETTGKEQYEPYTITVDWSELTLQSYSIGDFGNYDVLTEETIGENSPEKEALDGYSFQFDADSKVEVNMNSSQPEIGPYKDGIKGTIKEQALKTGTFKEDNGYFVPIKISFPGKDVKELEKYQNTWTLILNTEDGNKKEYTPTAEEYKQGWVMVLFKLNESGEKKIKYSIDFDGPVKDGKGYDFLPEEYTISYENLSFVKEETITYKYTDNKGQVHTEQVNVYEDATPKSLASENTDYRTFDGWYNERNEKVESLEELEGATLTAHWNLNVEKFMEDVVNDLNDSDTTYSNDFTDKFHLTADGNKITIHLDGANVPLTELSNTSIPGAIAYILQKGEIESITLKVGEAGEEVTFTSESASKVSKMANEVSNRELLDEEGSALKAGIIESAKAAFDKALENQEKTATLDELEFDGTSFTIKIDGVKDNSVNLVGSDGQALEEQEKTYTFTIDSNFAVVDQNGTLGAKDIKTVIEKNKYDTIYIDGDYTSQEPIEITAEKDVTIEPITVASPVSLLSENPTPTIKVEGKDYVIDVKKGNGTVTLTNLKITGAKKAQLMVEEGATVVADHVDVSGALEENQPSKDNDDMHAAILVGGTLTATNITNTNENYKNPTIARVTSFSYPGAVGGEDEETPGDQKLHPNAVIKAQGMTKNDVYNIIDTTSNEKIHSVAEAYYGNFYYLDANHSMIYFMAVKDQTHKGRPSPWLHLQIYYYDDEINFEKLGYKPNEEPKTEDGKVFEKVVLGDSTSSTVIADKTKVQTVLKAHTTNIVTAVYKQQPVANVQVPEVSGLSTVGNTLSGVLMEPDKAGKFYIPVTLSSDKFEENKTTVKVTDPNGTTKSYKYSNDAENGIATVSTLKTMKLELEAIKESKITGSNGKVYTIGLDIDGDNEEEAEYTVDYSKVKTAEEMINIAAKNTQDLKSLTVQKDNVVKGGIEKFTQQYDKDKEVSFYKDDKNQEYTFRLRNALPTHTGPIFVSVKNKEEGYTCSNNTCSPVLNDWMFANFFTTVRMGSHEISLLQDVMKETKEDSIDAIDMVEPVEGEDHTYTVTLNKERLVSWLNSNYIDGAKVNENAFDGEGNTVRVKVVLTNDDKYIKSMQTMDTFTITSGTYQYTGNKVNVIFSNWGTTEVKDPLVFLAKEEGTVTEEALKAFYEACKAWHKYSTGAEIYEG